MSDSPTINRDHCLKPLNDFIRMAHDERSTRQQDGVLVELSGLLDDAEETFLLREQRIECGVILFDLEWVGGGSCLADIYRDMLAFLAIYMDLQRFVQFRCLETHVECLMVCGNAMRAPGYGAFVVFRLRGPRIEAVLAKRRGTSSAAATE